MQTYKFTALNKKGHKISGEMEAENENELDESLKRIGLELRSFGDKVEPRASLTGKAKLEDIATMCRELAIALRAYIPMVESIDTIRLNTESMAIREALTGIRDLLRRGDSIADAFGYYPKIFNRFFISLIAIGEKTGKLHQVFTALEEYIKWIMAIRRRFIKVVRYPLASACFTTGVIWMLMIHMVCFTLYHQYALPDWLMKILSQVFSEFVIYYWPFILFGPAILIYATVILYRNFESFAYLMDRCFLRTSVLGDVIRKFDTARFLYFFSFMYNAGLSVEEALQDAESAVHNRVLRDSFSSIAKYIKRGMSLGDAAAMSQAFTPLVVQAFKLGESTGDISSALEKVTRLYRQDADDAIDAFADYLRYALLIMSGFFLAT